MARRSAAPPRSVCGTRSLRLTPGSRSGCGSRSALLRGAQQLQGTLLRRPRCCGPRQGGCRWSDTQSLPRPRRAARPRCCPGGGGSGRADRAVAGPAWRATRRSGAGRPTRMLTPHMPDSTIASWKRASISTQASTSIGSIETEATALAVMAWSWPSVTVVRIVTPVAKRPIASRNRSTAGASLTPPPPAGASPVAVRRGRPAAAPRWRGRGARSPRVPTAGPRCRWTGRSSRRPP